MRQVARHWTYNGSAKLILVDHMDGDAVNTEDVREDMVETPITAAEGTARGPESTRPP